MKKMSIFYTQKTIINNLNKYFLMTLFNNTRKFKRLSEILFKFM